MNERDYVGRRVRVVKPGHYSEKAVGRLGVIKSFWSKDSVGVELDGISNKSSKYDHFYFELCELEFVDSDDAAAENHEKENNMDKIENYLNVAVVKFLDHSASQARTYDYANFEPDLAPGDLCVVMSAHHGMGLAEVVEIKPNTGAALRREIVTKVDAAPYTARVEQRQKAAELKAKMEERAKQLQDLSLYQLLAKDDAEMAELLRAYLSATKS